MSLTFNIFCTFIVLVAMVNVNGQSYPKTVNLEANDCSELENSGNLRRINLMHTYSYVQY